MKTLVVYFSASGITKKLAKSLAKVTNSDIFEIVPKVPYTTADLDWTDKKSRSSIEMKDKTFRPEIANTLKDVKKYDLIFVGFPIWWYIAPTIVNTFLESLDLSEKIIVPFATSGGSGMGKTNKVLSSSCKGAKILDGKRFPSSTSEQDLSSWAKQFLK